MTLEVKIKISLCALDVTIPLISKSQKISVMSAPKLMRFFIDSQVLGNKPDLSTEWQRNNHLTLFSTFVDKKVCASFRPLLIISVALYLHLIQPENSLVYSIGCLGAMTQASLLQL